MSRPNFVFNDDDLLSYGIALTRVHNDVGEDGARAFIKLSIAIRDGHLPSRGFVSDGEIAAAGEYQGKPEYFATAVRASGWTVDGTFPLGRAMESHLLKRDRAREKKRRQRARPTGQPSLSAGVSSPGTAIFVPRDSDFRPQRQLIHCAATVALSTTPKQRTFKVLRKKQQTPGLARARADRFSPLLEEASALTSASVASRRTRTADEPASQAHVLAPLARARRVVVCKRSSPRVTCEPVVLAASSHSSINHAAMKSRREERDADRKARAAEARVANAADRQRRAQERQSLGVTAECVPAAAIDQGALCEFAEGLERDSLSVKEAKRAYLRYRDLAGSPINSIAVPYLRAACLAQACCRFGLSAGRILEHLHRMHHEQTGNSFAGVVMLAPAALDGACSRATSKGKPHGSAGGKGRPSVSFVDGSVVDPLVIEALRANEAGPPPGHFGTEAGWARRAVENAKLRASGSPAGDRGLAALSDEARRAMDVAAMALGLGGVP